MATALTYSIAADGQTPTTVRIPFSNGAQVNAGTVSLPALNFASNNSTGIYLPTAAQFGIAAGGVQALLATATGVSAHGVFTLDGGVISLGGALTTAGAFSTSGAHALTLTTTADSNVTLPTTGTLATLAGAETLTNKAFNASNNTLSNITTAMFATNVVDTDATMAADSNTRIPSQAAVVGYIGAYSRSGLLGSLLGADFNSTADQAIAISLSSKYVISSVVITNPSVSLTTAKGTFYAGAGKTSVIFGGSGSGFTGLVASTDVVAVGIFGNSFTGAFHFSRFTAPSTIYLSLTNPQGAPATADVYIFGYSIV